MFTNRGAKLLGDFWVGKTIKVMLLGPDFMPLRTHNVVSDINAKEISVSGYVPGFGNAGRLVLASKTSTEDDTGHQCVVDAADPAWGSLGAGTRIMHAALVEEVTNDAASPIWDYLRLKEASPPTASAGTANNPARLTLTAHGLTTNDVVFISGAAGGTWANINGLQTVTVIDANTIDLQGVNATGFGSYTANSATVFRPIPTNGSPLTITVDAGGLFTLNVQPAA